MIPAPVRAASARATRAAGRQVLRYPASMPDVPLNRADRTALASSTCAIHECLARRLKKPRDLLDEIEGLPPTQRAKRLAQLQGCAAELEQDEDDLDDAARTELLGAFDAVWDALIPVERRDVLRHVVCSVTMGWEAGRLHIAFHDLSEAEPARDAGAVTAPPAEAAP